MVAIRRNRELIMSPGPDVVIKEGDRLYFISNDLSNNNITEYLYGVDEQKTEIVKI